MALTRPIRRLTMGGTKLIYPLAGISNIWSALGLRLLVAGYAGQIITVRRSSDNATMDVYVAADGWLDTGAMLAWSGSDSVYVTKWWDQSGGGRFVQQSTVANQPRIVNAGVLETIGGKPAIFGTGGTVQFTSAWSVLASPQSIVATIQCPDYTAGADQEVIRGTVLHAALLRVSTAGRAVAFTGTMLTNTTPLVDGTPYVLDAVLDGASSYAGVNGSRIAGTAGTTQASLQSPGVLQSATMRISELIVLNKAAATAELDTIGRLLAAPRGITYP